MQAQNTKTNIKERSKGEYKVPKEIFNANWRDDVEVQAKEIDNIKQDFQFFDNEAGYDSRRNQVKDAERIARFQMAKRIRHMTLKSMLKAV